MLKKQNHNIFLPNLLITAVFIILLFFVARDFLINSRVKEFFSESLYSQALENAALNHVRRFGKLPDAGFSKPKKTTTVLITAYSSEIWQTDSTPRITASGSTVHHGVVASNFLPIGTRLRIPEIFGSDVFIVQDRMNERYWKHIDVWMEDTQKAKQFGAQLQTVEIF
ncbi:MAG: hypothetical protein ACD_76C00004G0004 [uncultured bacterium]|nr:MAG: hypothetical protein ACD_76C00004G0004 [uncultured bacterium]HBD05749.1 hypothetical protein [Candidatus Uhrbacteria bacterium]